MQILIRNNAFFLANLQISVFGLGQLGSLRICYLQINHCKVAVLKDWHSSDICKFAIAEWAN